MTTMGDELGGIWKEAVPAFLRSDISHWYLSNANRYTANVNKIGLTEEWRRFRNEERNKSLLLLNHEG